MDTPEDIVDALRNPFARQKRDPSKELSWVADERGRELSPKREKEIVEEGLFGKSVEEIDDIDDPNKSNYLAFLAIRLGYAELTLTPTEKWHRDFGDRGEEKAEETGSTVESSESDVSQDHQQQQAEPMPDATPDSTPNAPESPTRGELVQSLRGFEAQPVIERYQRELGGRSPSDIVQDYAFGSSIYRAFRHESPTSRYRQWRWYDRAERLMEKMNGLRSQEMFDDLACGVAGSLVEDWGDKKDDGRPTYMNMGIAMKITNLILKHLAFSEHSDNEQLKQWLHVPWDKYTLQPLQDIWTGQPAIPNRARQGFVDNLDLYRRLHSLISDIAEEAGVPRIVYELWGWDRAH